MKSQHFLSSLVLGASLNISLGSESVLAFEVALADPTWDGKKVPDGEQCKRFGGQGQTPKLSVKGIPAGAEAIVLEFNDKTYRQMDKGGHGKIGFELPPEATEVVIPTVPGHSFDLPQGFFVVKAHKAPTWDQAGAYLPPCSGGQGNSYTVTVKAVVFKNKEKKKFKVLEKATVKMGRY